MDPKSNVPANQLPIHLKLVISIIVIILVSIFLVIGTTLYYISQNQDRSNIDKIEKIGNMLYRELLDYQNDLKAKTKAFVADDNLKRAVRLGDIFDITNVSSKLRDDFKIDLLEIVSPDLKVLGRGHVEGVYGDSRDQSTPLVDFLNFKDIEPFSDATRTYLEKDRMIPLANLNKGEPSTLINIVEGYFLKVVRPIIFDIDGKRLIGLLVVGKYIGKDFIRKFKSLSQADILLYANKSPILSSRQNLKGHAFNLGQPDTVQYSKVSGLGKITYQIKSLKLSKNEFIQAAILVSDEELNKIFDSLIRKILILTIFIIVFFIGIAVILAKSISRPIISLTKDVETIASGDLSKEIIPITRDEIGILAYNFDWMRISIKKKINELLLLDSATKEITNIHIREVLLSFSLDKMIEIMDVRSGAIFLVSGGKLVMFKSTHADGKSGEVADAEDVLVANQVLEGIVSKIFDEVVGLPLTLDNELIGVIILNEKRSGERFTIENIKAAEALCGSISIACKNVDLLERTAETTRMEQELETTRMVQSLFFPPEKAECGNIRIFGVADQASECGGDLWGYFINPDGTVYIYAGDGTGHGVPAALITAAARSALYLIEDMIRQHPGDFSPRTIMTDLNHTIYNTSKQRIMMTFFLALVDDKAGKITFTNAGHNFPYILFPKSGDVEPVLDKKAQGPRLGYDKDFQYEEVEMELQQDYSMFVFTDGLIEATNPENKEYGEKKLRRILKKNIDMEPERLAKLILQDNIDFRAGQPLEDDSTFFVLQRKADVKGVAADV